MDVIECDSFRCQTYRVFYGKRAIKYIKFRLPQEGQLQEPDVEIELDPYRSYNRSKRSGLSTSK